MVVEGNPFHPEITGVSLGAIPSLVLLDGQRIYKGTILEDGSVHGDIAENQLILTGPQGKRKIPLNLALRAAWNEFPDAGSRATPPPASGATGMGSGRPTLPREGSRCAKAPNTPGRDR